MRQCYWRRSLAARLSPFPFFFGYIVLRPWAERRRSLIPPASSVLGYMMQSVCGGASLLFGVSVGGTLLPACSWASSHPMP